MGRSCWESAVCWVQARGKGVCGFAVLLQAAGCSVAHTMHDNPESSQRP